MNVNLYFLHVVQHEAGRLWFARFVNAQRVHNKKVDESTFYSLVQYFAIVLFECADADDFSPAKSLMNMCFTFYHEGKIDKILQHFYAPPFILVFQDTG